MADDDSTRFKEHLALLRQAGRGLGKDVEVELSDVGKKVERFPKLVGRDAEILAAEIEYDFVRVGVKINRGIKSIPGEVAKGARAVGRGALFLGHETKAGAVRAKEDMVRAKKAAKKDVKSGFARAAGVKTSSLNEWSRSGDKDKDE